VVRELGSKRRKVLRPREVICVKNLPHIGETLLFFPNNLIFVKKSRIAKRVTPREVGIELKKNFKNKKKKKNYANKKTITNKRKMEKF
jgi:hypothetical protein